MFSLKWVKVNQVKNIYANFIINNCLNFNFNNVSKQEGVQGLAIKGLNRCNYFTSFFVRFKQVE